MRITPLPAPYRFGLRPFLLNGIEVRTVRRQKLHSMTLFLDGMDDVAALVERRIIHDDDGQRRRGWQQCCFCPCQEDVGIDGAVPEVHGQKGEGQNGSDGIQTAFGMPIASSIATRSHLGIALCTRCIHRKPAFIEIHDRTLLNVFVPSNARLELQTTNEVSLWVTQSFFYS